jgi:hypothetical protein
MAVEGTSLMDIEDTNPVTESTKQVYDYATKSAKDEDFTNRLTDEQIADVICRFRKAPEGGSMESMVDIVQSEDFDPTRGDEHAYPRTIWTPVLEVGFAYLHACGPDPKKPKFPVDNVASRTYGFMLRSHTKEVAMAMYNLEHQEALPGFDLKKDHRFFFDQLKKLVDKVIEEMWNKEDFAVGIKNKQKDEIIDGLMDDIRRRLEREKAAGTLDDKEFNKKMANPQALIDKVELEERRKMRFIRGCTTPMIEDKDHPGEWKLSINIPVFKKIDPDAKLAAVRPETIASEFARMMKEKEAEEKRLDKNQQRVLRQNITKGVCEAAGYILNPITYTDHRNKPLKQQHYRTPVVWENFLVRAGFTLGGQCTKAGAYGVKARGKPRIQILKLAEPPKFTTDPDETEFGDDWTMDDIVKVVGKDRMDIGEDIEYVAVQANGSNKKRKRVSSSASGSDSDSESESERTSKPKVKKMKKTAVESKKTTKKSKKHAKKKAKKTKKVVSSSEDSGSDSEDSGLSEHEKKERATAPPVTSAGGDVDYFDGI